MVEERSKLPTLKPWMIIVGAVLLFIAVLAGIYAWKKSGRASSSAGPFDEDKPALVEHLDPHKMAVRRVEEDRGVPVGNKAKIEIPAELKLYKDRRRFLAVQVAAWREQKYEIPEDFSDLAVMIGRGEFVILPPLGSDYILYGVGLRASNELTYFDPRTNKSIPLFGSLAEAEQELARLGNLMAESETKILELKNNLAQLKKNERAARKEMLDQIAATQKAIAAAKARRELLGTYYGSANRAETLVAEYRRISEVARDLGGRAYDLGDPAARQAFKVSLLSALRPPARAQLEEIARAYKQKFDRPLPVTSLVRTIEYQRHLGDTGNPNAIRINVPPHTTGLAFDIYTYYMSADEQQFLMDEIARLEKEGRVEALREERFHIHVFAFADAKPPDEKLVQASLNLKAGGGED
jgi:Family of unknown function (DUF5715)